MKFRLGMIAGLIAVTVGCSSYSPSTPSGGTGATGTPVSIVRNASVLTNTAYAPNPIAIGVGETITFPSAGTFAYHCTIHPNMIGTVTVR